ncbi:MAG TPA: rod shape-determining protein MreC [Burkholderiales bacterium]|nr:rod shape-determining protein MreC [Burkholderiales bacterium]
MEYQAPPFFKTGPTPLARLLILSALSLALLISDARFNYLAPLRQVAAVILYPLQRIALAPASIARRVGDFFVTHSSLRTQNDRLERENFENAGMLQELKGLRAENERLRALLGARKRFGVDATAAEVVYAARDPFSRRIVIDKGMRDEVKAGQPVVDENGLLGQVTRVYPWLAEVTLVTDKSHFVPVQNLRNGLRAVLSGTGSDGVLELRFVPVNADHANGDELVTSGIDGVYPPGLPVARISQVERSATRLFARITCTPLAGVSNHTQVLLLSAQRDLPPRPAEQAKPRVKGKARKR